jgi:hypothetical protein
MNKYIGSVLLALVTALPALSQLPDDVQARIDSLERAQARLLDDRVAKRSQLDSLNRTVALAYEKKGLMDTIAGAIERPCVVYQSPDVLSAKLFESAEGDSVVVVDFADEWFKIMHKSGTGFILDECVGHDERIQSYKEQRRRRKDAGAQRPTEPDNGGN